MLKIGYRTLKTSIGAGASILIAQLFQLDHYVSAGILTILCIKGTKKRSFTSAGQRILACLVGIVFSFLFFEGIAFHPLVISLMLLMFIPTAVKLKVTEGIVTSAVIFLHLYTAGNITLSLLVNELALIIIGIGIALVLNLYMPSLENDLRQYQIRLEENFKEIFRQVSIYLREGDHLWDGRELTVTDELIETAKSLAFKNVENHLYRNENYFYHYFQMREKQFEVIERILPIVSSLSMTVQQSEMIAGFIDMVREAVHPENTAVIYLTKLNEIRDQIRKMDLPESREEFEVRAMLYMFLKEMEEYLTIKRYFKSTEA